MGPSVASGRCTLLLKCTRVFQQLTSVSPSQAHLQGHLSSPVGLRFGATHPEPEGLFRTKNNSHNWTPADEPSSDLWSWGGGQVIFLQPRLLSACLSCGLSRSLWPEPVTHSFCLQFLCSSLPAGRKKCPSLKCLSLSLMFIPMRIHKVEIQKSSGNQKLLKTHVVITSYLIWTHLSARSNLAGCISWYVFI